jgi:hypothetical protein
MKTMVGTWGNISYKYQIFKKNTKYYLHDEFNDVNMVRNSQN